METRPLYLILTGPSFSEYMIGAEALCVTLELFALCTQHTQQPNNDPP